MSKLHLNFAESTAKVGSRKNPHHPCQLTQAEQLTIFPLSLPSRWCQRFNGKRLDFKNISYHKWLSLRNYSRSYYTVKNLWYVFWPSLCLSTEPDKYIVQHVLKSDFKETNFLCNIVYGFYRPLLKILSYSKKVRGRS
jgi:hypothetical protein